MLPVLLGVAPFAFVTGAISVNDGASVLESCGFSLLAFAGASQIAALNLLSTGAPAVTAVAAASVVNLRFLLYAAALGPDLAAERPARKALLSYLLTDHAFALTTARTEKLRQAGTLVAFYLGAALAFWVTWQAFLLAGSLAGPRLARHVPQTYLVALSFLALLVPMLRDRRAVAAALGAAVGMIALDRLLPSAAVVISICVGLLASELVRWLAGNGGEAAS
jgi:predicted branched-subunit amino acid permease